MSDSLHDFYDDWLFQQPTCWKIDKFIDWMTIDGPTDWRINGRKLTDWQTDVRIDDWRTEGLGLMNWLVHWLAANNYHDWSVMSDYLNRPDSLNDLSTDSFTGLPTEWLDD